MVVRLTRARRATSSRATRWKPCCSNSATAASRMASVVGSGRRSGTGIALERITVVAQPHWQMIPHPVHRLRAPDPGEALVAALLAFGPRQLEQNTGPWRQPTGGQEGGD